MTFFLTGTLNAVLEKEAYIKVNIFYNTFPYWSGFFDICDELRTYGGDVQCPVPKGDVAFKFQHYWEEIKGVGFSLDSLACGCKSAKLLYYSRYGRLRRAASRSTTATM
jgi:hypothetical protein